MKNKKKYLLNKIFSSRWFFKIIFYLIINFMPIKLLTLILYKDMNKNSKDIHANFKKKTKLINFWLKINCFFDDINEFQKIKRKNVLLSDFEDLKRINNVNKEDINFLIYNFFLLLRKISTKYPLTANILFSNYFNISKYLDYKIYFKNIIRDYDYDLSSYLLKNFYLRNMTHCFFIKNKKKFISKYLKKFSSHYCVNLLQVTVEYNIGDAKLLNKIHSLIDKKKIKSKSKNFNNKKSYGLDFYAFGHQLIFIDFFHRMKIINKLNIKKKILMSPNYISNTCLSMYIQKKYKNLSKINDNLFFKELSKNNFEQRGADTSIFGDTDSLYNLTYKEYKKFGNITPSIDKNLLKKVFSENRFKKLKLDNKYICLFHRDALFKNENFINNSLNEDRTVDLVNYKDVINFLCEFGYKVVLMGSSSQKKIQILNKNFVDYAHSKFKNDFNDIYLAMNCDFFLNFGQSGFINFSHCFNKFSLNLEFPLNRKPYFHDKCFYALRPFHYNNKLVKTKDYFNDDLFQVHDFEILKSKGYSVDITPENKLIKICKKFINVKNTKNFEEYKKFFPPKGKVDYFFNIIE